MTGIREQASDPATPRNQFGDHVDRSQHQNDRQLPSGSVSVALTVIVGGPSLAKI